MLLALLKLVSVKSDILITLSIPQKTETAAEYGHLVEVSHEAFQRALRSFKVLSLDVFSQAMET